jgi:hypothetical protein
MLQLARSRRRLRCDSLPKRVSGDEDYIPVKVRTPAKVRTHV